GADDAYAAALTLDDDTGSAHFRGGGLDVIEGDAVAQDVAGGRRGGDHVRPGLDAVGHDGVVDGLEALDAFDDDDVRAGARDVRAHLVEDPRELLDLGLTRGIHEGRSPAGEGRGRHEVLGAGDRGDVEADLGGAQAPRGHVHVHVAVAKVHDGAHGLEALEVLVDGPSADRAAARQRDRGLAVAGDERPEHEHGGSHLLDEVVRRGGVERGSARDTHDAVVEGRLLTETPQQSRHRMNVPQI